MATVYETEVEIDAPANINTGHSISVGDEYFGRLLRGGEDWIEVNLLAGRTYVIDLAGDGRGDPDRPGSPIDALPDPVLRIYDDKGDLLAINDDISGATGDFRSRLNFQPTEDGVYFLSAGAFDKAGNDGNYRLSLRETRVTIEAMEDEDGNVPESAKLVGSGAAETLLGLGGNDILEGRGGNDILEGRGGDDTLIGGAGADALRGGFGSDTASWQGSPEGVTVSLESSEAAGGDAEGDDVNEDIENLRGSSHADDLTGNGRGNRLYGDGGNDELNGRGGDDSLDGGAGDDELDGGDDDDTLEGGPGADRLEGGDGSDTASYAGSRAPVDVRLHSGGFFQGGDAEGDTFVLVLGTNGLADIEHLTGSDGADILAGDSRNNDIRGGDGDDLLYGGPGAAEGRVTNADTLEGGDGDDMLFGGPGDDTLNGGDGNDVLSGGPGADRYNGGKGQDIIYADFDDISIDESGVGSIDITGDYPDGTDTLSFERVDRTLAEQRDEGQIDVFIAYHEPVNVIIGSPEDDVLTVDTGWVGTVEGGAGGDTLTAADLDFFTLEDTFDNQRFSDSRNPGGDILSYASSDGPVDVNLQTGAAAGGHARGDTISGFENLRGSSFDDFLAGDDRGNDIAGNTIEGGPGGDDLSGGAEWTPADREAWRELVEANPTLNPILHSMFAATRNPDFQDWLSYQHSEGGVVVDLDSRDDGSNRPSASGGDAEGDNIAPGTFENVRGGRGNDRLTGDQDDNVLHGGPGADHLDGGAFARGTTPDDFDIVTYLYAQATSEFRPEVEGMEGLEYETMEKFIGVTVDLVDYDDSTGDAEGDTFANIERYDGSDFEDTFILSIDIERDNAGMITSLSSPLVIGGGPFGTVNTVSYRDFEVEEGMKLTIEIANHAGRTGSALEVGVHYAEADTVIDAADTPVVIHESITNVDGTAAADRIFVEDSRPMTQFFMGDHFTLRGLGGDDELTGGIGDDHLAGGAGNDDLNGGEGSDDLSGGDGDDILNGGDSTVLGLDDRLAGNAGNDELNGGTGDDELYGGAGNDDLNGGGDFDELTGGTGNDDLNGGGGNDVFIFASGHGDDFIEDFDAEGDDTIDLSAFRNAIEAWYLDELDIDGLNLADGIDDMVQVGDEMMTEFEVLTGDDNGFIRQRGASVVIDLIAFGGGTITLEGTALDMGDDAANQLNPGDLDFMAM